ncbi:FtsX-like permease family protein [Streptomyces exfoliatus]|uniref:FtsX-like permease family protein n=1 Tax=Streptomyces exfoliatus TaxID=1905 RepID=UPI003C2CA1D5
MTGFVFLRVRAHRLLLVAALLAVLLTTSVLATLASFSGAVGDAALQAGLRGRSAAAASLHVSGQVPADRRADAEEAVREGTRRTFDGLPVTVRRLERSGPYALPRSLKPPAAHEGDPDLTHFAALDRSRLALVRGAWPSATRTAGVVETALPEEAARRLRVAPGTVLDLGDRLDDRRRVKARITGVYRPVDTHDLYWRLDPAGGRGVRTVAFTTYGPLLVDPAVMTSGALSRGDTSWLGSADFTGVTTDRIDTLRATATEGPKALVGAGDRFGTTVAASTALPTVLEQTQRALLVSRSTLLIVAVQLVLLAAYALLLVARLLSTERASETTLLRARGGSRRRIAGLAATEALLLALPAALAAPLLSGPLTRLFAERSAFSSLGVRLDTTPSLQVWLVAAAVALCCAAAVVAPALAAGDGAVVPLRKARSAALPGPVRAGADLGLLAVAAVAYWQLRRPSATGGTLGAEGSGGGSVDPVLIVAPALALLAGTVLTLRLLPPAAKLAERRAAGGRGLSAALAGWQFSRRPLRGAGPVLLLVLAMAMGMLAIGQSGSWERSQRDQADFRAGADVRVLGAGPGGPTDTAQLTAVPGVRAVAPAFRTSMDVSGKNATVLAMDTRDAAAGLLLRPDLADVPVRSLLAPLVPRATTRAGLPLPAGTRGLTVDLRLAVPAGAAQVTAVLEDPGSVPYRQVLGQLPDDGRTHRLTLDLDALASAPGAGGNRGSAGLLTLTGLELTGRIDDGENRTQTLHVERFAVVGADAGERVHAPGQVLARWTHSFGQTKYGTPTGGKPTPGVPGTAGPGGRPAPYALSFGLTGTPRGEFFWGTEEYALRTAAPGPKAPDRLPAVATAAFMAATGAEPGELIEVSVGGARVKAFVEGVVDELPTTGPGARTVSVTGSAATPDDGGTVLLDLASVNRFLAADTDTVSAVPPNEWWLAVAPGRADEVAAALRARPDADPAQILVRDEIAAELLGDPLGAGPNAALMGVAAAAAALAAVGFAVGSAGAMRERSAEFGVLRALGTPRRRLARLIAAEQGLLIGIGLLVGGGLGTLLARAVVPLVVLTGQAARPVPPVLVELPLGQVALLLAGVAALPLAIVAVIALRPADPVVTLRHQGDH